MLFLILEMKSLPGRMVTLFIFLKMLGGAIGDDFVGAIMEFFSSGSILKQINHTAIALVPKSDHTPHIVDYRSISCYNVT